MSAPQNNINSAWRIVAGREISTRLSSKSFVWGMASLAIAVVALVVVASLFAGRPSDYKVAVTTPDAAQIVQLAAPTVAATDNDSTVEAVDVESPEAAEQAVADGEADVALLDRGDGYEVVGNSDLPDSLGVSLSAATSQFVMGQNAAASGTTLQELGQGSQVTERLLDPAPDNEGARSAAAFVFVIVFYITAIMFGMTIAQSVVTEKESRVVEILAAAVPIRQLLWGKIVGNSVLAFGQIALVVVAGIVSLLATGERGVLDAIGNASAWYVVFFVLGFVALAGFWAVAGALASRQEDLSSTTMPGQVILFAPYFVAILAGESVKTVVSMMPIMSAMLMPARLAEDAVPMWQVGVAIAVNVVAAVVLVAGGAKIYERTLMRTGNKIGFREALSIKE